MHIEIKDAHKALAVADTIGADVFLVDLYVRGFVEGETVERMVESKNSLSHFVELKVGTKYLGIEVVALFFQLLAVVGEVPVLQLKVGTDAAGVGAHLFELALGEGQRRSVQPGKECVDGCGCLGHCARERIGGIVGIAQQLGLLEAQLNYAAYDVAVVVAVAAVAAAVVGLPHLLAQAAVVGIGEEGTVGGCVECEEPPFKAARGGFLAGRCHYVVGQAA